MFWINHVKAVKLASRFLTKHEFIELKYEDLWNDTEKNLLKLIRFLDLEWDDEGITAAIQLCSIDSVKKGTAPTFEINGEISKLNGPLTIEPKDFVKRGYPGGWRKELNLFEKIQIYLVIKRYFDNNNEYSFNLRNFLLPLK